MSSPAYVRMIEKARKREVMCEQMDRERAQAPQDAIGAPDAAKVVDVADHAAGEPVGVEAAFSEIAEEWFHALVRFVRARHSEVGEDAEEIAQDVLMRLWDAMQREGLILYCNSPWPWLCTAARYVCATYWRSRLTRKRGRGVRLVSLDAPIGADSDAFTIGDTVSTDALDRLARLWSHHRAIHRTRDSAWTAVRRGPAMTWDQRRARAQRERAERLRSLTARRVGGAA